MLLLLLLLVWVLKVQLLCLCHALPGWGPLLLVLLLLPWPGLMRHLSLRLLHAACCGLEHVWTACSLRNETACGQQLSSVAWSCCNCCLLSRTASPPFGAGAMCCAGARQQHTDKTQHYTAACKHAMKKDLGTGLAHLAS
jgi:hypothetical protein